MHKGLTGRIRQIVEVLPTLALAAGALVLAVQISRGRDNVDDLLVQLVIVGAMLELVAGLMDVGLSAQLADRLALRLLGFVVVNLMLSVLMLGAFSQAHLLGAPAVVLLVGFMLPRFITFVCLPPRIPIDRMRVRALARDRFDSLLVMLGLSVVPFSIVVIWILIAGDASFTVFVVPTIFLALWFMLIAASVWHVYSPSFARAPQRLLTRWPWWCLAHWLAKVKTKEEARREREAELAEVRAWQP